MKGVVGCSPLEGRGVEFGSILPETKAAGSYFQAVAVDASQCPLQGTNLTGQLEDPFLKLLIFLIQ